MRLNIEELVEKFEWFGKEDEYKDELFFWEPLMHEKKAKQAIKSTPWAIQMLK